LDECLGFGELINRHLVGSRHGKNPQLSLADLLRQSVCNATCLGSQNGNPSLNLRDCSKLNGLPSLLVLSFLRNEQLITGAWDIRKKGELKWTTTTNNLVSLLMENQQELGPPARPLA
jgi:hypothetical protein